MKRGKKEEEKRKKKVFGSLFNPFLLLHFSSLLFFFSFLVGRCRQLNRT